MAPTNTNSTDNSPTTNDSEIHRPTPPDTLPQPIVSHLNGTPIPTLKATQEYITQLITYYEHSQARAEHEHEQDQDQDQDQEPAPEPRQELPEGVEKDGDVPGKASLTVKSINDNRYYYWQWRDGDAIKSQYVCPAGDT